MLLGPFKQSNAYSMGVELELQLINLTTFDLSASSPDLLHLLAKNDFPGHYTPEMTESMIEICTDVQTNYAGVVAQLTAECDGLIAACDKLNIGICGGGTHPFQLWTERKIFDKERFTQLSNRYGYLAKQFTVFGQHIHIGCLSGDDALFLLHSLSRYLPHFIALAASSPFIQHSETFFDSARLNSVFAFPLSGHAPFVLNWEEFDHNYFAKMQKTGTINSMKDFYWDLRPKPEYGTLELRVCDTPLTVRKAADLAGYLQTLAKYLLEERALQPEKDDYLVYNYNRFQACRFGLDGAIVDPKSYASIPLRDDIVATLAKLEQHGVELDSGDALANIRNYASQENDAAYLRQQFAVGDSMEYVVHQAISRFRQA